MTADEIIAALSLAPHPEGGHYRETFRDTAVVPGTARAASTAIYYLLKAGEISRWHRVDAVEIWHWHAGAPLELRISPNGQTVDAITIGPDVTAAQFPQGIVPRGAWQSARSLGDYTLVGCTVAPDSSSRDSKWPLKNSRSDDVARLSRGPRCPPFLQREDSLGPVEIRAKPAACHARGRAALVPGSRLGKDGSTT